MTEEVRDFLESRADGFAVTMTTREIAEAVGCSEQRASDALAHLEAQGIVRRFGEAPPLGWTYPARRSLRPA